MYARLAIRLRPVVLWLFQAGITAAGFWIIDKIFDRMLEEIKEYYDLSDDDTRIIIANNLLEAATFIGVGSATMASKIPIKLAKKLGFANGKVVKRVVSKETVAKIAAKDGVGAAAKITTKVTADEIATAVSTSKGFSFATVSKIANVVVAIVGVPVGVGLLVVNTIDFAAWPSSSYQDTFQKFFSWFGMNPDAQTKNSKVISEDMWKRIYATFQTLGAVGITDPYAGIDKPFTRENLIGIVDKIAAEIIKEKGSATFKEVFIATQAFIVMGSPVTDAKIANAFKGQAVASAVAMPSVSTSQITKVFTGIVSQGVVGQGLVFTARPDDMIESADELKQAASNNLAPFLNTLLGKIVYEVKVVSSIITKEGFKQTGTTQRIQSGTYSNGQPKYKSVTNKFATLVVYALTDKGSRAKLTTIVLGPVDSAKLIVSENDLRTLESSLPALVTTTDINEINVIKTDTTTVVEPKTETIQTTPVTTQTHEAQWSVRLYSNDDIAKYEALGYKTGLPPEGGNTPVGWAPIKASVPTSVPATVSVASNIVATSQKAGANATTLYEWYQAQGQALPSVSARSVIYEGLGLGSRNYYSGTTEQNTKLLSALKAQ